MISLLALQWSLVVVLSCQGQEGELMALPMSWQCFMIKRVTTYTVLKEDFLNGDFHQMWMEMTKFLIAGSTLITNYEQTKKLLDIPISSNEIPTIV